MIASDEKEPLAEIRYTANFAANLEGIAAFWDESGFAKGYDRLLEELTDVVLTHLERHPRMGRPFMNRQPESIEAQMALARLDEQSAEIREYVMDDYLVLYSVHESRPHPHLVVQLLAIKHHKQLSFWFQP
ncbi:type II toxin-antitoxin system RelE/ParE family toxin [Variovorax sp. OV700]|uniref:type II toxin-antitoxin system RelE/ParE family toxin n=1 Tax=Variovorax sp. OV700 TaxID=1882826 RepID=UPI00088BD599|nr:type II toxin-antitoxin system RelE/ParE family toxin [Variovorax sp. OV700]SDH71452.1 ParE toxin of type II toxin-antitoxin system, parDE [Variovorax sp. OV700]